jgi:hypothetical protein
MILNHGNNYVLLQLIDCMIFHTNIYFYFLYDFVDQLSREFVVMRLVTIPKNFTKNSLSL